MSTKWKPGDEAWYVPGYGSWLIAIRVRVTDVEWPGGPEEEGGVPFYWVDEPVGYALGDDELFATEREAREALLEMAHDHDAKPDGRPEDQTLWEWRRRRMEFIASTWEGKHPGFDGLFRDKVLGKDWFSLDSIGRGMS